MSGWQQAHEFFASQLFHDVQLAGLFVDSKTFADAIGKRPLSDICVRYEQEKQRPNFNLAEFVAAEFDIPTPIALPNVQYSHVDDYITAMWTVLKRQPDTPKFDSLIPLQHAYVVPGGRFREIYYWDSYFTALGLMQDGHTEVVISMLENFLDVQAAIGCIPNGNRAYYHSRSQPPVLALLFDLVADQLSVEQRNRAIAGLEAEYQFWMTGVDQLSSTTPTHNRVLRLADGSILNRYYDSDASPRPESYREDSAEQALVDSGDASELLRHIRAACESGWDFSSRWFVDADDFTSIRTTAIVPVDLNALLYLLELRLSELVADNTQQVAYAKAAARRKQAINTHLYDAGQGFYFDIDLSRAKHTKIWSLAAAVPLFVGLADNVQASAVATVLARDFMCPGGLITTLHATSQQWDRPNGWAPLQWFAAQGLKRYGHDRVAQDIMQRWVNLVQHYYAEHGVVLEKYNVCDISHRASGGEYEVQLGFGWTNGVYRAFQAQLHD